MANGDSVGWQQLIVPGLLGMIGFLAWYGIQSDISNVKQENMEAKEMATKAFTVASEARVTAATSRPDPFTGTDGRKLREECFNQIDSRTALVGAQHDAAEARLTSRIMLLENRIDTINSAIAAQKAYESECRKDREDLRRRVDRLEQHATPSTAGKARAYDFPNVLDMK